MLKTKIIMLLKKMGLIKKPYYHLKDTDSWAFTDRSLNHRIKTINLNDYRKEDYN